MLDRLRRGTVVHLIIFIALVLGLISARRVLMPAPASPTPTPCASWTPSSGSYKLQVCLRTPVMGSSLAGNVPVTASVSAQGTGSIVRRVVFLLDGAYVLTDYQPPYSFTLPTNYWPNGSHKLAAEAVMANGSTSRLATVMVTFVNRLGTLQAPAVRFHPTSGRPAGSSPFIVAAAGDGASGEGTAGSVADRVRLMNPNLFLYLGDVYERGSLAEFFNWYGDGSSSFSALRSITDPTPGNHEYLTPGGSGYFQYWDNIPPYYSFEAGGWHFISLNSSNTDVPAGPGSAQYLWLQHDLAALAPGTCSIAYYHRPLFNIGPEGPAPWMSPIWKLLAQQGVKIVLNGHDHDYQRWQPLDGDGNPSPGGVTEFVVGSGGHGLQHFTRQDARVAASDDQDAAAFGALQLQLGPAQAVFRYVSVSGAVLDAGKVPCSH